ncbi:hypothetical protein B0H63DRAFT_145461 [Podospora didyma]|uniref:Myb-like domain-containing protein n=1 Tax=Podospora didyma TaxID=330526 RepID=A0AAE0NSN3_9PEZI|nr:hypothetical protein B0H63DRAFT_145461 [Podospora didyma]
MNKNWNDRADKDLFFTILSVKNIGVISGAEWTTIGNHMRSMGYGFTNEGCRQHFQGLRRASHKSDSGPLIENNPTRKIDPALNPITRRPGPGRGRPRKHPQPQPGSVVPGAVAPGGGSGPVSGAPGVPGAPAAPGVPGIHPAYAAGLSDAGGSQASPGEFQRSAAAADLPLDPQTSAAPAEIAVDPSLELTDEKPPKRPKLASIDDAAAIEDEVVMNALSAHNNPTQLHAYPAEFNYGET